jgi:hypothetical protein
MINQKPWQGRNLKDAIDLRLEPCPTLHVDPMKCCLPHYSDQETLLNDLKLQLNVKGPPAGGNSFTNC